MDRPKTCLVVGGAGFIGSHIVEALLAEGLIVRVLGRNELRFRRNLGHVSGLDFHYGDVGNRAAAEAALEGVDSVAYLAHSTVPANSMADLVFDLETNVATLIRFLELVRERPRINRILYFSSGGTIYGDCPSAEPITEDFPARPISGYGLAKLTAEHYLRLCLAGTGRSLTALRPANVYGPRQNLTRPQGAVGAFLMALHRGAPVTVFGDGGVVRDFVHVSDCADAARLALLDPDPPLDRLRCLNVGSGQGTSLSELIGLMEEITGRRFEIRRRPDRGFDCRYNVLDSSRLSSELGWRPRIGLAEGLRRTWEWIQDQAKAGNF